MMYFDNCATTRAFDSSVKVAEHFFSQSYMNSSAPYALALENDKHLIQCREVIARSIGAGGDEIYFTSGGTESNNTVIFGALCKERNKIIISATEHPSVYEAALRAQKNGAELVILPVDNNGVVSQEELANALDERCAIVSIMHVNNETGTINPIERLAEITHQIAPKCIFHSDGVQAHLRVKINVKTSKIDAYSISGHKIHATKGIGALYVSSKVKIEPLFYGGGQQNGFRSGTVNLPAIAAYADAVENYGEDTVGRIMQIKEVFINKLQNCVFNSVGADTAPHVLSVAFPDIQASTLQNALEGEGVIVGKGSACSSRSSRVSRVLQSMNIPRKNAEGTIRIGIGAFNTVQEANDACEIINAVSGRLMRFKRK